MRANEIRRRRSAGGFSLLETMVGASVLALAAMGGVAYVAGSSGHADSAREDLFARHKALSILSELRAYVEGGKGEVAADLDGFDDGLSQSPTLSIAPDPDVPGELVPPDHPLSGNIPDRGDWRWYRRITVRRFPGLDTRDLRIVTVRIFRYRQGDPVPGWKRAEVSSVIRTIGDTYPTTQVYDVYLIALENVPGWWVFMDSIKPFVDATLADLEARNPGLEFRAHWITTSGYGRDERYAPYTNEDNISTDTTPWAYVYPGRMPAGSTSQRYYVPSQMRARMNLDGQPTPAFVNDYAPTEPFTDSNGNGRRDAGEPYTDVDGDLAYDLGNAVPYALADMHNHCMRWPDEDAKFRARVAAGLDRDDAPTMRLLLDRMIADPARFHNAIFVNLHGELLPMPAVRNYSDAARDPVAVPGWRAVAHPEHLRPRRTPGNDAASDVPRWRVYAYRTEILDAQPVTTMREPFRDANRNGVFDAGDGFDTSAGADDWNGNGRWDDAVPISLRIPGPDHTGAVNAAASPSLVVRRLTGGVDADATAGLDAYQPFANAPRYPEVYTDSNGDGRRNVVEAYFDRNVNGVYDAALDVYQELDGDGLRSGVVEALVDTNGNGQLDVDRPAERWTELPGQVNGRWDAGDPYFDIDADGVRDGPTNPTPPPWRAWTAADDVSPATRALYAANFGEPYKDVGGDGVYTRREPLVDNDGDGVWDGGYRRFEMWFSASYDVVGKATDLRLHGTPLACPEVGTQGLDAGARLYDLEYVPCPMIASESAALPPFSRDLADGTADVPKNTARWTVEIPLAQVRAAYETAPGARNGDGQDRLFALETRLGSDTTTGTMWPVTNRPENVSRAYSWFHASTNTVPFSERYQFQGDPRHSPYADTGEYGTSYPNGTNWYFDDFQGAVDARNLWRAFEPGRLRDGWMGRNSFDTARLYYWLRSAVTQCEAVYTTLTGFSYYYMSLGGDVGYDSANGYPSSIPMDGTPFGQSSDVFEDTIAGAGTSGIGGSLKYVRSNSGSATGIRSGGYWWSKPWIGELCQDSAFSGQWAPWGNLRAASGSLAGTYRLIRRGDVVDAQEPAGTNMANTVARTREEGCTSFFDIGTYPTPHSTFHHQYRDGETGTLTGDGPQLQANYNFPMPTTARISRPFRLNGSADGGVGPEFTFTTEYPRFSAAQVTAFYGHQSGATGSSLVRLVQPGGARAGYIVVNGIDKTIESGSAFIARYSLLSLVHSFFAAGAPGGPNRIKQLPRLGITAPTLVTELVSPASIAVRWHVDWQRWDGRKYTLSYPLAFAESEPDLVYVVLYSRDNGRTWINAMSETPAQPGVLPLLPGGVRDPLKTLPDAGPGDESWTWPTPAASFPEGNYLLRVETYRASESLHYSWHQEKIYVQR